MIPVTAIWIIDEHYLLPAYLSIASCEEVKDVQFMLVYCGTITQEIRKAFKQVCPNLVLVEYSGEEASPVLQNRFARMELAAQSNGEVVMLMDADMLFTTGVQKAIDQIREDVVKSPADAMVWGVEEYKHAYDAWLYFKRTDLPKQHKRISIHSKREVFHSIWGKEWESILSTPQFNNGLLAFYNGLEVAKEWKHYYQKGLTSDYINPADDQVPLAGALATANVNRKPLANRFNSLGLHNGSYSGFHVWDGRWKVEINHLLETNKPHSDYGKIAAKYIDLVPENWKNKFRNDENLKPHLFRDFQKYHDFVDAIDAIVKGQEPKRIVIVDDHSLRNACYLAESIKYSEKQIEVLLCYRDRDLALINVQRQLLEQLNLSSCLEIVSIDQIEFEEESLDVVLIPRDIEELNETLEYWFSKLKAEGVLVGIDSTLPALWYDTKNSKIKEFTSVQGIDLKSNGSYYKLVKPKRRVPLLFHFTWFQNEQSTRSFSYHHYLCLMSVVKLHQGAVFRLYINQTIVGQWADAIPQEVELVYVDAPTEVFGQPLKKVEHRSDVFRLRQLLASGGIYMDLDVFCLKPLYDLMRYPMVMGAEKHGGLCNAVILAENKSPFIQHWMEAYHPVRQVEGFAFDPDGWAEMSVAFPKHLSYEYQGYIKLLPPMAFYDKIGTPKELNVLFNSKEYNPASSYAIHLWESQSWKEYLAQLTPEKMKSEEGYFYKAVRNVLSLEEIEGESIKSEEHVSI